MTKTISLHKKTPIRLGLVLTLIVIFLMTRPAAAQEPLPQLRLLAWSSGGTFLLGATPDREVTLPDETTRQLQRLWRLSADGAEAQPIAEALDPQLTPGGRFVSFTRLNAQNQPELWGIDTATGALHRLNPSLLLGPDLAVAGDPPGRVYPSPAGTKRAILVNQFFNAALWVGQENVPARLILSRPGEIFSDLAWRPDGQTLAFIRTPLGSETEPNGELWRIDLADNTLTRLSQNNVVDRSPIWSPDGSRLAVVRNGRWVRVPGDRLVVETFSLSRPEPAGPPPDTIGAAAQLSPPATIRVIHHASNTCRTVPVGQIDTYPFEEYVKRVVPYEVYPSWPAETLKAQAVAARTYGWDKYFQNPTAAYHVTDWVNHQYMCDTTVPSTNQAVEDTAGEYLAYNGQIITAMFSAENSSPTKTNPYAAYLQAVDDPVSFGQTRNGHGYGMGQWGAQRWAAQYNWSYQAILRHYYTNVTLEERLAGSDTAPPNVSLVDPWSNHYLTSSQLHLLVNTSDDGGSIAQTNVYLSTPAETNLLVSEPGPANSAGYVIDVSSWADQPLLTTSLVLTAEAFDGMGRRGFSPPVPVGLDRVAPTGLLTTAATLTGTTIITDSPLISLTLTASDETAGLAHLAMGRKNWEWEGESLIREVVGDQPVGRVVSDTEALNELAMQATVTDDPAGAWTSSELILPAPRQYRALFRMKVSTPPTPDEVARLEVLDVESNALIGLHRLRGLDFRAGGVYQEFHVDFDLAESPGEPFILRLNFEDTANLWLDRIVVVEYPTPFTTQPTYDYPNFRLKIIDGAGNVSDDLLVLSARFDHNLYLPLLVK